MSSDYLSGLVLFFSLVGYAVAVPPVSRSRSDIESFRSFLEKSRTEDGIRLESRMLANPKASVWENSGKFEGDILLNDEQAELMLQQYAQGRNAYIWPNTKWPSNTIVYEFNNEFTTAQVNAIYAAMREISARTCVRFRRREARDFNFVRITGRADGCYANVGYWSSMGVHTLNLARDTPGRGCFTHTVIIHEWLHVVGFMHMQSTHNRDSYVRILWQNIWPGMEHNFEKYGTNIVNNMGLPYEYASNMHYGRYGFSINGQATMLPIFNDNGLMGQQQFVTGWDWLRANRHYNCPGAWNDVINHEDLSKSAYEFEPKYDEIQDLPLDEVVEEIAPQEEVVEEMEHDLALF
ncbi:high choriolytic enzyme 2-like [Spodoptera litura]|uniref:Metalloendopeptidase n=1 Tax=Spodoptera litura TaxID=69820 RepID=A0A9J7E401_SPOLT|nr:high choriolytic enzyme 2-like [Spodoptera litura]